MRPLSYYASIADSSAAPVVATGDRRVDVCVVGGGLTGLSAAAALARDGASVILVEAGRVGDGASGRNGGQMIPGMRHGAVELVARFGPETAKALIDLTLDARANMLSTAARHDCPVAQTGHLTAASHARDPAWMDAEVRCMTDALGYRHLMSVDAAAIRDHVASDVYHGGIVDRLGGHVDPLRYTRALADEARDAGVEILEASPVRNVETLRCAIATDHARIRADDVVLACDASIGEIAIDGRDSPMAVRLMPVRSYLIATAPLSQAQAMALLPSDMAVSDTRFALDYFRLSSDRRLLFSGGERYTLAKLRDIAAFVRRRMKRVFPELGTIAIDYAWEGVVAVTTSRFPDIGRHGRVWHAHGYSGHGLLLAQAAGRAISTAIGGRSQDHALLSSLPTRDWPGGRLLRHPLYTTGMLWFAMRDRL